MAMVASGSTPALLFWNWVNQSQNALVNYYNRNAASALVRNYNKFAALRLLTHLKFNDF